MIRLTKHAQNEIYTLHREGISVAFTDVLKACEGHAKDVQAVKVKSLGFTACYIKDDDHISEGDAIYAVLRTDGHKRVTTVMLRYEEQGCKIK